MIRDFVVSVFLKGSHHQEQKEKENGMVWGYENRNEINAYKEGGSITND
jgi:hypothetical protein